MVDEPEPDVDPLEELELSDSFRQRVDDYERRLSTAGLILHAPEEPEPAVGDYIERYLQYPPSYLADTDSEGLTEAAIEAWAYASKARTDREVEAGYYLIALGSLAGHKEMLVEVERHLTDVDQRTQIQLHMRQQVFNELWLKSLWREPWVSLVEAEFPGPAITQDNIDQAEATRAEVEEHQALNSQRLEEIGQELEGFLADHGLIPEPDDLVALSLIVQALMVQRYYRPATEVSALLNQRLMMQELIQSMAGNKGHPAWTDLLDYYFPVPEEA